MASKREFILDMHVHSMYSGESMAEPRDIIEAALSKGLDGICITEHESLSASAPFEHFRRSTDLVILRGVEISTDTGHMLVYGIDDREWRDWGKDRTPSAQELVYRVRRLGGLVIPAHPYIVSASTCGHSVCDRPTVEVDERIKDVHGLAALEVCSGKHLSHPAICQSLGNLARSMGLPGIGGSDAHVPHDVGCSYTVFRTPIRSNGDLVEAIRRGWVHPENRAGFCHHFHAAGAAHISAR